MSITRRVTVTITLDVVDDYVDLDSALEDIESQIGLMMVENGWWGKVELSVADAAPLAAPRSAEGSDDDRD